jgi:F-type H+-transporting ATPase subunit delta
MVDTKVAHKYAQALLSVAQASDNVENGRRAADAVDAIGEQLRKAVQWAEDVPELLGVLRHPRIARDRKKRVIQQFFTDDDYGPLMRDFLSLLVDKKRAEYLPAIERQYVELVNELRNVMPAKVVTAVPLTEAEREMVIERLKQLTGHDILLQAEVNPRIIGGLIIHAGGHLIDGSLVSHLEQVKERLKQMRVTS